MAGVDLGQFPAGGDGAADGAGRQGVSTVQQQQRREANLDRLRKAFDCFAG